MSPQKMAKKDKAAEMASETQQTESKEDIREMVLELQDLCVGLNNKYIKLNPEQIKTDIDNKCKDIEYGYVIKFVLEVVFGIVLSGILIYKTPSDLSIQNTINDTYKNYKADIKEYIDDAVQKQFKELKEELKQQNNKVE